MLAEEEPLTLTEIALRLRRTPGSTKDYLSWLEDVDLIVSRQKRYSFADPLLRLWVRLHGRAVPPADEDIAREVHAYVHDAAAAAPSRRSPWLAAEPRAATARRTGASSRSTESVHRCEMHAHSSHALNRSSASFARGLRRFLLAPPFGPRDAIAVHEHLDLEDPRGAAGPISPASR